MLSLLMIFIVLNEDPFLKKIRIITETSKRTIKDNLPTTILFDLLLILMVW